MQVKVKQRVRSDCKEIKVNECKQCNSGYGYIKTKSPKKTEKNECMNINGSSTSANNRYIYSGGSEIDYRLGVLHVYKFLNSLVFILVRY